MVKTLTIIMLLMFLFAVIQTAREEYELAKVHESIVRENERLKTKLHWICNDSPTHEACEELQAEARLNK